MKLSVIMSVFNGERYLASAIDSILAQSFRDFEFLIVDDGSTDQTAQILEDFAAKDARIRVIRHAKNKGLTPALNGMIAAAKGEYLARMDGDDISLPDRFARQIAWLDAHPECGVLGTSYWVIDPEGRRRLACYYENDHDFLTWYLCFQNPLAHPSVMGRTELFRRVGGYCEKAHYSEDYELWWRLSRITKLGSLPELLLELRQHSSCVSLTHKLDQILTKQRIQAEMLPQLGVEEVARVLPITGDKHSVALRSELIRRVYECFAQRTNLTPRVKSLIRKDAAARLGLIWLRQPLDAGAGGTLAACLSYDPLIGIRAGWTGLRRLSAQAVDNPILR